MTQSPHHDMGTCWCGNNHSSEYALREEVRELRGRIAALEEALRKIEVHPWGETTIIGDMARRALADAGKEER